MKIPDTAPEASDIFNQFSPEAMERIWEFSGPDDYRHWDDLKYRKPPEGMNHQEWWCALKMGRKQSMKSVPLRDARKASFCFNVPDKIARQLHEIDLGAGGKIGLPEMIANPDTRDQYLIRSLMEEAITSSQLEGAVTTREVAKEMLRSGRKPKDKSERMILNNFRTMQKIRSLTEESLTTDLIMELHHLVTEGTLDKSDAAGRFRTSEELITVEDEDGNIMHLPPPAVELPARMKAMCDFANGLPSEPFIHPAIRAMILHFWLAYDHPFVDGNGRTARALFYWAMLHSDYWLFEYISISDVLKRAPAKYYRAFLLTEHDGNDLTYFLLHQSDVIRQAIARLHEYIGSKTLEIRNSEKMLKNWRHLNHRQQALISHALRHPGQGYTVEGHQRSHDISNNTARADLIALVTAGLLDQQKTGKKITFYPSPSLEQTICKSSDH